MIIHDLFMILVLGMIYFLPSIIAIFNDHKNFVVIFILNFLTGWTGVGWLITLLWALLK
jgi:hypothetical protein